MKRFTSRLARQRGQAYAEYLVVTGVIATALLVAPDVPAITALAAAFKSFFGAYSFTLSLP